MTATELYEIVTGHQDVWGKHFVIVKRSDGYVGFYRPFSNDELDPEHVENELLGLGVKWLASGGGTGHSYIFGMIVGTNGAADIDVWAISCGDINCRRTNILAAVYAAIAEVKRAQASTENH